jgi:hypothetical protein
VEIIPVSSDIHINTNTHCEENAKLFNIKSGGKYNIQQAVKVTETPLRKITRVILVLHGNELSVSWLAVLKHWIRS